jgi:sigma-E factor negative regulatory protein RseA
MNQKEQNRTAQKDSDLMNTDKRNLSLTDEEALSALMDGELSEFELRRLLSRVDASPELRMTWERYNLARAAFDAEPLDMRSASLSLSNDNSGTLLDRIMMEVDQQPLKVTDGQVLHTATMKTIKPWQRDMARLAIAASVALAVFVGMQSVLTPTGIQPDIASASATTVQTDRDMAERQNVQVAVDEEAQQRLNDYIRSVSIPGRSEAPVPFNILEESSMLRPVSDLELIEEVRRDNP